jgi:FkbM family methyltransferase
MIKTIIRKIVNFAGYEINKKSISRKSMTDVLRHILKIGYAPKTVIDVGVAQGTYDLYESFPNATHILIEPLVEFKDYLKKISDNYKAIVVNAAASDIAGEVSINVHRALDGSSLLNEAEGAQVDGVSRVVEAVRIDDNLQKK